MKKVIFLSLILLITISVVTNVYATSSFEVSLKSSKTELNKGDEFTVDVQISNINIDKGIIALGGTLEFDKESLELVKMEGENTWARPSYNSDNGKFATDRDDYATNEETIFKIIFKVKEASKQNLTITLSNVAGSNGKDEIKLDSITTNITVKNGNSNPDTPKPDTNTSTDNTTTNTTNTSTNTNTNNDKNNNITNTNNSSKNNTNTNSNKSNTNNNVSNTNTNTSNNTVSGILPSAGTNSILFGTIGLLIIVASIFYIRIRIIDSKAIKNNIIK